MWKELDSPKSFEDVLQIKFNTHRFSLKKNNASIEISNMPKVCVVCTQYGF